MPPYREKKVKRIFDSNLDFHIIAWNIREWLIYLIKHNPELLTGGYIISAGPSIIHTLKDALGQIDYLKMAYKLGNDYIDIDSIEMCPMLNPWCIEVSWRVAISRKEVGLPDLSGFDAYKKSCRIPHIEKVIYNDPATIIFWSDKTKTVVQCQEGDDYDPEKGLAMAIAKKALGNTSRKLNDVLHKWEKKEEPSVPLAIVNMAVKNYPKNLVSLVTNRLVIGRLMNDSKTKDTIIQR